MKKHISIIILSTLCCCTTLLTPQSVHALNLPKDSVSTKKFSNHNNLITLRTSTYSSLLNLTSENKSTLPIKNENQPINFSYTNLSITDFKTSEPSYNSVNIKVNRDNLPESMKKFTKISVFTDHKPFNSKLLSNYVKDVQTYGYGLQNYNEDFGFGSAFSKDLNEVYALVLLFDDNNNSLGYETVKICVSNAEVTTSKSHDFVIFTYQPSSDPTLGAGNVKIDRNKLPEKMRNFTKLRFCTTNTPVDSKALDYCINTTKTKGYGITVYNDTNGYNILYHINDTEQYGIALLMDDNINILGYTVVKLK